MSRAKYSKFLMKSAEGRRRYSRADGVEGDRLTRHDRMGEVLVFVPFRIGESAGFYIANKGSGRDKLDLIAGLFGVASAEHQPDGGPARGALDVARAALVLRELRLIAGYLPGGDDAVRVVGRDRGRVRGSARPSERRGAQRRRGHLLAKHRHSLRSDSAAIRTSWSRLAIWLNLCAKLRLANARR